MKQKNQQLKIPFFKRAFFLLSHSGWLMKAAFLISILTIPAHLLVYLLEKDEFIRILVTDIIFLFSIGITAIILIIAAAQTWKSSHQEGWAWGLIAAAHISYFIGDLIWAILEVGSNEIPFPSPADYFYLAYFPLFLAGAMLIPRVKQVWMDRVKDGLDIWVVLLSAVLFFWTFLIGPLAQQIGTVSTLEVFLSAAYPIGDFVLLWALLLVLYKGTKAKNPDPLLFLSAGIIAMIVTDSFYSVQTMQGGYISGGLLDIGWLVAYTLTIFAGAHLIVSGNKNTALSSSSTADSMIENFGNLGKSLPFLPFIWILLAFALLVTNHYVEMTMSFSVMAGMVAVIILLIFMRQAITYRENQRLITDLNQSLVTINQQASQLEQTNLELKNEIRDRQRAEDRLSFESLHDPLTGLPNRALFNDRLKRMISFCQPSGHHDYAVLYMDFDHFKHVNDSFGHSTGDKLLIALAERFRATLRGIDSVARFGGDEFVVLLENVANQKAAETAAQRLLEHLKDPYSVDGHDLYLTASIGIVLGKAEYADHNDILRDADIAMYHAKAAGKARFEVFRKTMRSSALAHLRLETELRQALEKKQFRLVYQPIYDLIHNSLIGFEALLRWKSLKRGTLLPAEFLPAVEQSGLIIPIGEWVINEACRQLHVWREQHPTNENLTVNVNISGRQFSQPFFTNLIKSALQRHNLPPSALRLEITETVLIENQERAAKILDELRDFGVQFEIDDFGVGYSSLGYLHRFPVRAIKIDRSFINGLGVNTRDADLIRMIVQLAHSFGIKTVAEGIETGLQLEQLRTMTCDCGQGFMLARPLEVSSVERLIKKSEK